MFTFDNANNSDMANVLNVANYCLTDSASYADRVNFVTVMVKASKDGQLLKKVGTSNDLCIEVIKAFIAEYGNDQPSNDPKPTGKAGGSGEFYFWPEHNIYAPMVNGCPCPSVRFDEATWQAVSLALPSVTAIKKDVLAKAAKVAEPTKYSYSITVNIDGAQSFESLDSDLSASELTLETLNRLLADNGVDPVDVTFGITKGKTKKSRSSGTGQGSGFYTASDRGELKPLNVVQKQVLEAASSIDGLPLSEHDRYGRADATKLGNIRIEFQKKGYNGALRIADKRLYFDVNAMYDGYDLAHSLAA
jgi:hypothetical protein